MSKAFGYEKPNEGESNDWITPRYIIDAFNNLQSWEKGFYFDLDPCSSATQPWATALNAYTVKQNGLSQKWVGPYGAEATQWIQKLSKHGQGIALVFARTETALWQNDIFPTADGFLFIKKRIAFYEYLCECGKLRSWHLSPSKKKRNATCGNFKNTGIAQKGDQAGAPSVLIAWGEKNRASLINLVDTGAIEGAFLDRAFCTGSGRIEQPSLFREAGA